MKRIVLITAAILMMTFQANAQGGLGGLLGKLTGAVNSEGAGSLVTSITDLISGKSALSPQTIAGTWNYTGSAISFKSDDNVLSNIAGAAAKSTLENKLDGYLKKVGITEGLFLLLYYAEYIYICGPFNVDDTSLQTCVFYYIKGRYPLFRLGAHKRLIGEYLAV